MVTRRRRRKMTRRARVRVTVLANRRRRRPRKTRKRNQRQETGRVRLGRTYQPGKTAGTQSIRFVHRQGIVDKLYYRKYDDAKDYYHKFAARRVKVWLGQSDVLGRVLVIADEGGRPLWE